MKAATRHAGMEAMPAGARLQPNVRWVECATRTVKDECLSKMIFLGEASIRRALAEFQLQYHADRPHRGNGNVVLFPEASFPSRDGPIQCRERLGGASKWYCREVG